MNRKTLIYEIINLKKVYNSRMVLQIGKLQIHRGTIYGVIGPVGSGKTSLLLQIAGLEKPTEGSILYDEHPFKTNWMGKIKKPDEIHFVSPRKSVSNQLVADYFSIRHGKRSEEIRKHHFNNGFRRFLWNQPVDTLSHGESSWVNLVEAVESDPRVLIVDNYGSMLDDELENDLSRRLIQMNRNLGTTIILSSTNATRLQRFSSVLIFLDKGHVAKIRSSKQFNGKRSRYSSRR